jgi:hypothetical protein
MVRIDKRIRKSLPDRIVVVDRSERFILLPNMLRLILLALSAASLGIAQGPLRLELKHFEKKTKPCVIQLEYPEIVSAASAEARDRMNAGILRVLLRRSDFPGSDSGFRSLDEYANGFLKSCEEFQSRPEARGLYEYKMVTIFRYTPPILSFRCDATEDAGGVHPFGSTFFVNFESETGKTVALTELLKEGSLPKLTSLAEEVFRRDHKLSAAESLSEQGYGFPDNRFKLNDNFGVGERELLFLFNTYEIGAGAMPATEIRIDHALLRGLLKRDLRLEWP